MKIQVTADDIARGAPCEQDFCPVALALHRATGRRWLVGFNAACTSDGGHLNLPLPVQVFVKAFDAAFPVEPFEFEVSDQWRR